MWPPVANELHTNPLTRKSQDKPDWDRWTKYLHENDININPFDRLQWISDEGRFLALGLNDTGAKMNFNISDWIRSRLTRPITESSEYRSGKAQFDISYFSSVPGGGKTRLLLELPNLRTDFDALYFVTLNDSSALFPDDDEVHKLEEGSQAPGTVALRNLVTVLGQAMLGTQIFSFMAGTLISGFHDYEISRGIFIDQINLPLLSHAHQYAILDNIPQLDGWRCCTQAKELLSQLGGLPRLLEVFIRAITDRLNATASFDDVSWKDVEMTTKGNEVAKSFGKGSSPELAQHLIDAIMLRKLVMPGWKVIPGSSETYGYLHQNSNIILQPSRGVYYFYCVTIPLLAFRNLVETALRGPGDTNRFQKLCELLDMDASGWKTFEKFAINHTAIMDEFFNHAFAKDYSFLRLALSQRYASGYGGAGQVNIQLLTLNVKVINRLQKLPKESSIRCTKDGQPYDFTSGNCYLNVPGASFADGFYVCYDEDGFYGCDDDDHAPPKLVIGELYKQWNTKKLQFETCIQEHEKK